MRHILLIICLAVIASCAPKSEHKGFKKTFTGIHYKLIQLGELNIAPQPGDYITIDFVYKTMSDSVFFSGHRKLQLTHPDFEGSIDECFEMLDKGDKAEFIIHAGNFFSRTLQSNLPSFLETNGYMKVEITMIDIQSARDYEKQKKAFLKWIEDFGDYEREILSQYIHEQKITMKPTTSGLYYIKIRDGNGRKVKPGDTLTIDYEGRFLDGKFFDSTIKRREAFYFVYGTEWQVVKGLEEAVALMEESEKALVILPSELAFGNTGSSTGIIPPYTSIIFEIELKKIN